MEASFALHASIIQSISPTELEHLPDFLIIVSPSGEIIHLEPKTPRASINAILINLDYPSPPSITFIPPPSFLIPGLIDTHTHAPQWSMRGLGGGLHILDWLSQITFPHEARFSDLDYAQKVYTSCVAGGLKQGITTTCYYASLHAPATNLLADICLDEDQRAFIGKCNMDNHDTNPDYYREESAGDSIAATESVIAHIQTIDHDGDLVRPILTPRFAISCTPTSLSALGHLATTYPDIPIQTHFCEAEQEVNATLAQYPDFTSEADLYHHHGLLNERSVLAHCTTVTDYDVSRLRDLNCGVAHCPVSNTTVGGGFMAAPIRHFLDLGIKVGLGTDSGGGFSSSINDAMRQAVIVGNAREMLTGGKEKRLGVEEVFYMATLGGAKVLGLDGKVGRLEVGKELDAVCVKPRRDEEDGVMTMIEDGEEWRSVFEKWVMTGDDRNIKMVGVRGRWVRY